MIQLYILYYSVYSLYYSVYSLIACHLRQPLLSIKAMNKQNNLQQCGFNDKQKLNPRQADTEPTMVSWFLRSTSDIWSRSWSFLRTWNLWGKNAVFRLGLDDVWIHLCWMHCIKKADHYAIPRGLLLFVEL